MWHSCLKLYFLRTVSYLFQAHFHEEFLPEAFVSTKNNVLVWIRNDEILALYYFE